MAKILNISNKLSLDRPKIIIGNKEYEVNDGLSTVLKFEELVSETSGVDSMLRAITVALGEKAAKEIDIESMSLSNFKVVVVAILAAMQDIEYEEAEKRFQDKS